VALSHRWGPKGESPLSTTSTNIRAHRKGIPLQAFPATFQDAIKVTRALGFKYIWIDSLCIIQDSTNDWISESAHMADIYTNATLTIAADFGTSPKAGLLPKTGTPKVREFTHLDTEGISHRLFVRRDWPRPQGCPATQINACYASEAVSQLDDRAWTMQERVLSRRTVFFTNAELVWECDQIHECSCHNKLNRYTVRQAYKTLLAASKHDSLNGQRYWLKLVETFAARQLTYVTDRLPALTGIASMVPFPAKDYLAGLWRGGLRHGLVWVNPLGRNSRRIEGTLDTFPKLAEEGINCRISDHYAPSWSWASIWGPAAFGYMMEEDAIGKDWHIINAQCTPRTSNPFGPVSEGFVEIEGSLIPITVQEELRNVEQLPNGKVAASRELCVVSKKREHVVGISKTYMDADVGAREWEDESYDYFVFIVGVDSVTDLIPIGMILRRPRLGLGDCYTRIGMSRLQNWSQQDVQREAERCHFRIV